MSIPLASILFVAGSAIAALCWNWARTSYFKNPFKPVPRILNEAGIREAIYRGIIRRIK